VIPFSIQIITTIGAGRTRPNVYYLLGPRMDLFPAGHVSGRLNYVQLDAPVIFQTRLIAHAVGAAASSKNEFASGIEIPPIDEKGRPHTPAVRKKTGHSNSRTPIRLGWYRCTGAVEVAQPTTTSQRREPPLRITLVRCSSPISFGPRHFFISHSPRIGSHRLQQPGDGRMSQRKHEPEPCQLVLVWIVNGECGLHC
jgi:hypothetical protein